MQQAMAVCSFKIQTDDSRNERKWDYLGPTGCLENRNTFLRADVKRKDLFMKNCRKKHQSLCFRS